MCATHEMTDCDQINLLYTSLNKLLIKLAMIAIILESSLISDISCMGQIKLKK